MNKASQTVSTSFHRNFSMTRLLAAVVAVWCTAMFTTPSAEAQAGVLPLGSPMPVAAKQVTNSAGAKTTLGDLRGQTATVVVFWSNKCPWCTKVEGRLASLVGSVDKSKVSFVLVNSNDADAFPGETRADNAVVAERLKVAYISDEDGSIKNAFGASRAPHFFVFDKDNTLVYLGSFDDSPGDEGNVTVTYLADALANLQSGKAVAVSDTKAFGCMIKPKQ